MERFERNKKMKGRGEKIEVVVENFGNSFLSPSCDLRSGLYGRVGLSVGGLFGYGVGMRGMVLWWI